MLSFKEAIASNGKGVILVTLQDGRCATVGINERGVCVEVLIDSFLKWGGFDQKPSDGEIEEVLDVLKFPEDLYESPLAKAYLEDQQEKENFDRMKKEAGYNY